MNSFPRKSYSYPRLLALFTIFVVQFISWIYELAIDNWSTSRGRWELILLAQFSLHVHKGGLKPHSFHFISLEMAWDSQCFYNVGHVRQPIISFKNLKSTDLLIPQNIQKLDSQEDSKCRCSTILSAPLSTHSYLTMSMWMKKERWSFPYPTLSVQQLA